MTHVSDSLPSQRLARFLSAILSPPIIALGTIIVFAFFSPIGTGILISWQSFILGLLFIVVGPILPLSIMVARGRLTVDVRNRHDRPLLYLAAILVYIAGAIIAWFYLNQAMMVIAVAYAAVTTVIALISLRWKISAHTAGVAGPITGLIWVYGVVVIPLMLLALVVGWARWHQNLHSAAQLTAGIVIATMVTATVYWMLWGPPLAF